MVNRGAQAASNWMLRRRYSDFKLEVNLFFSKCASFDKENSIVERYYCCYLGPIAQEWHPTTSPNW